MKKSLLMSVALLTALAGYARTLTPEEALARVNATDAPARVASMTRDGGISLVHTEMSRAGVAAAYIFSRPDAGYMIVSADDAATPLLGYGDASVTADTPVPPQLQWWLGEYAAEIESASDAGVKYIRRAPSASAERTPIAPLLRTVWNQDAPFNNLCPTSGSAATYTGCVATAMAQVMKYFNYPDKGKGTGTATVIDPSTGTTTQTLSMNLGVNLEWDKMLDSYNGTYTSEQASAVARLMKACGYSVSMKYSTYASGAQSVDVPSALVDHFGYDKACVSRDRLNYPIEQWEQMIYDNLATCGPVFYAGSAPSGGHAFVCDGYSSDRYFHFNWGWGGAYNGYFRLTALEPEGQGIGGYAGGYNTAQLAIFNIRKPVEGSEYPVQQLTQVNQISVTDEPSRLNFSGGWANFTGRSMTVDFSLEFTPVSGGDPVYYHLEYYEIGSSKGVQSFTIPKVNLRDVLTQDVTYQARVVTKQQGSDVWQQVLHSINIPDYLLITRSGSKFTVTKPSPAMLTCVEAELLTPVYYNSICAMNLKVRNDQTEEVPANVAVGMINSSGQLVLTSAGTFFDLLPGEEASEEVSYTFAKGDADVSAGAKYTLVIYDTFTYAILKDLGEVTCQSAPKATLTLNSFSFVGDADYANLDDLNFSANITCNSGYYGNSLVLAIYTAGALPKFVTAMSTPDPAFINAGETKDAPYSHINLTSECALNTYYLALPAYFELNNLTGQLDATFFTQQHQVRFRATQTGIEVAGDDADAPFEIYCNSQLRSAIATGSATVSHVAVYSADGKLIAAPVEYEGTSARVDLSAAPAGMAIVVATDADGNTATAKIMLR